VKKHLSDPQPGRLSSPVYFGCRTGRAGHHAWLPGGFKVRAVGAHDRWLRNRDGMLPPSGVDEEQGACSLSHPYGVFTVLSFWDRSVDRRAGSHSDFALPGLLGFESAVAMAREYFPEVFERLGFELRLVDAPPPENLHCVRPAG